MFRRGLSRLPLSRDYVARIAELRLREFSPANPRWQATASYCDELSRYAPFQRDLLNDYVELARDYTRVLGREISPQDLAPAVPGWKCGFKGKESS